MLHFRMPFKPTSTYTSLIDGIPFIFNEISLLMPRTRTVYLQLYIQRLIEKLSFA